MRHLRPGDYRVMPWKNGGGSTTEIAISPEGTGLSGTSFEWRVSIADVGADGPFSRFPGYDRHIMLIAGEGMILDAGDEGEISLSSPFKPAWFCGDWDIRGRLAGGPVRDFNLMVARAFARSMLTVERPVARCVFRADGGISVIHFLEGEGMANGHIVASGDTIIIDDDDMVEVKPLGTTPTLAICRITPR